MKFLLDQDVYAITARFLRESGHDVILASDLGLSRAADEMLLQEAEKQNLILTTRDRDYGNLVFVKKMGAGVIYLRMLPSDKDIIHKNLGAILKRYTKKELANAFVVVETKKYRVRKIR